MAHLSHRQPGEWLERTKLKAFTHNSFLINAFNQCTWRIAALQFPLCKSKALSTIFQSSAKQRSGWYLSKGETK
jgi:hypothetical protein